MPTAAYLSAQGTKQGNITQAALTADSAGNKWQEDHQDEELVLGFKHEVDLPTERTSGQPAGQRVHRPLKVTTAYSKSTPLWYNALTSGERLSKVEIKWYRTSMEGQQEHYFTHKLTDVTVTNITAWTPNVLDPAMEGYTHMVDISLSYRKIEWKHEVAGTIGADDWRKPVTA